MKVLQLNAWGGRLGKVISDLFVREQADVICLQEAHSLPTGRGLLIETLEEMAEHAQYPHVFFMPQWGYNLMKRKVQGGMAVLSKTPFEKTYQEYIHLHYIDDFDLIDTDYNVRGFQHVVVNGVNILNHHGHHIPTHKNGDEETMRQMNKIADYIKGLEGSTVLCGDFNLSPEAESLQVLNKTMTNHAMLSGVTTTRTPLTHKKEVCDYIFTSPDIKVSDFKVLEDIVSDHEALTVTF